MTASRGIAAAPGGGSVRWPLAAVALAAAAVVLTAPQVSRAHPTAGVAPRLAAADAAPGGGTGGDTAGPPLRAGWQGFFLSLNVGYGSHGGEAGPAIPQPNKMLAPSLSAWRAQGCVAQNLGCYDRAVTTARGDGLAVALQVGYNVLGYASIWADLAWKGSFGAKVDTAGTGTVSLIAALHPLRFWRPDAPFDVRLYGGYGLFDILYYWEAEFQGEAKGKAWTGTAIPFGLSGEWRVPGSVFALGADLRFVAASYDKWVYNNDKDISSSLADDPQTTFRFEPRVTFGWHF